MKKVIKSTEGITLVALVVTIVVLLILALVTINMALSQNGLFGRAKNATTMYKQADTNESQGLNELGSTIDSLGSTNGGNDSTSDGSWSNDKGINTPKISGTGLHAVSLASDGSLTEVTDLNSKWYDYSSQQWANAVTKDNLGNITGYFVWIPRYEYKISETTVTVKFIDTKKETADTGYLVHPAFTANVANGGWISEISGFWVAKYPAGYQASTIDTNGDPKSPINASDTVVRSNINYTGIDNSYTTNAVDNTLNANTKMSYPVFKPLTYAYNCIRIGDSYSLARDIQNASDFYGLSGVDSHMEKNSEWGAVAYLTQSNYGRNGTKVNINNYNMNNANLKNTYCITGLYGVGTSDSTATSINSVNAYNTSTGIKGSSTGNITGVYDLNGCIWEREASYITNGNPNLATYGKTFAYLTAETSPQTKNDISTRWATAYPYDNSSDDDASNWKKYSSFKSNTYGFGDAILETSTSGSGNTSWNGEYAHFPYTSNTFFARGGYCDGGTNSGTFSFGYMGGACNNYRGFRVILVP